MKKTTSLSISFLLALLPGLWSPASATHTATTAGSLSPSQNAKAVTAPLAVPLPRAGVTGSLKFVKRLVKEKNARRKYTVDASYPQLVGAKEANAAQFNRLVRQLFMDALNDFKKNAGPPEDIPKGISWSSFYGGYSIEYRGPRLISVAFGFDPYYAGAVHALPYSMALNYDLQTGRTLALSDLFTPRAPYLQVISDYAIKDLTRQLGESSDRESIESGAAPDSKNYMSWNITGRGLSITFDPYQVAAYAFGKHHVVVPYAALRQLIDMDGPLGSILKK